MIQIFVEQLSKSIKLSNINSFNVSNTESIVIN